MYQKEKSHTNAQLKEIKNKLNELIYTIETVNTQILKHKKQGSHKVRTLNFYNFHLY